VTEFNDTHSFRTEAPPFAIIFDLDGTLIDSRNQISAAIQVTRQTFDLAPATEWQLGSWFGMKPDFFFFDLPTEFHSEAISAFRDELRVSEIEAPPFPEVTSVLTSLREMSILLAVATTKPGWLANHVMKVSGLLDFFIHIQGTDDFPAKPAPDVFYACLENLQLESPNRIWGIGDRVEDAQAASAAGVAAIGLIRRESDPDALQYHRAGALTTVNSLDGLLHLVEEQVA
jgi:phosphoglycolate phosphatase